MERPRQQDDDPTALGKYQQDDESNSVTNEIALLEGLHNQEQRLEFFPTKSARMKQKADPEGTHATSISASCWKKEDILELSEVPRGDHYSAKLEGEPMTAAAAASNTLAESQPGAFPQSPGVAGATLEPQRRHQPYPNHSYLLTPQPEWQAEQIQPEEAIISTNGLVQSEEEENGEMCTANNSDIDDDVLVEAELVVEASQAQAEQSARELVKAEPMPNMFTVQECLHSRNGRRCLVGGFLCILIGVGIVMAVLAVVLVPNDDDDNQEPTPAPTSFVEDLLPIYTQVALEDSDSPQAKAYEWYLDDLEYQQQRNVSQADDVESFVPIERFVLATFFHSVQGTGWNESARWLHHDVSACHWYHTFFGSICSTGPQLGRRRQRQLGSKERHHLRRLQARETPPRNYYNRLSLYQNNLNGTLPPELSLLSFLDVINLHGNHIHGSIPSELGTLEYVTLFQLFQNDLSGTVPTELALLKRVKQFNLGFNKLTGNVPTELGLLSDTVESFSVSNNLIHGSLPTELGLLTACTALYFYKNQYLTGPLPTQVGTMTRLQVFQMNHANWTGTIPTELGMATNLAEVYLHDNTYLEGTIPSKLHQLTRLSKLSLHNTNLLGSVPQELCDMMKYGSLAQLSVDCERVRCGCSVPCDCTQTDEGDSGDEIVTDPPVAVTTDPSIALAMMMGELVTPLPPVHSTPPPSSESGTEDKDSPSELVTDPPIITSPPAPNDHPGEAAPTTPP